jgi:hypothetical protein
VKLQTVVIATKETSTAVLVTVAIRLRKRRFVNLPRT